MYRIYTEKPPVGTQYANFDNSKITKSTQSLCLLRIHIRKILHGQIAVLLFFLSYTAFVYAISLGSG